MTKRKEPMGPTPTFNPQPRSDAFQQLKALLFAKSRRPPAISEEHVLSILALRRAREQLLGDHLFADPGWDVLLQLYAAELGERPMTALDLAAQIPVPRSTVERWMATLIERGLVHLEAATRPPHQRRVGLTEKGSSAMRWLHHHWSSALRSI